MVVGVQGVGIEPYAGLAGARGGSGEDECKIQNMIADARVFAASGTVLLFCSGLVQLISSCFTCLRLLI